MGARPDSSTTRKYILLFAGILLTNVVSLAQVVPPHSHVVVVAFENHSYEARWSWKQYAECMPNSTYGVARGNIRETSPVRGCGIAGNYMPRHIPAIYYAAVRQGTAPASDVDCTGVTNKGYVSARVLQGCNVVQFENPNWGFAADIAAKRLPNFSFVTPSAQNDGHDGSRTTADTWMKNNLRPLLSSCYFTGIGCAPDGLLIVWWDEGAVGDTAYIGPCATSGTANRGDAFGSCNGGGRVAIVIAGKDVMIGYKSGTYYQHPALTKTILEALDLPANGFPSAVRSANTMAGFFKHVVSNIDDVSFTCASTCSGNSTYATSSGKQLDGQSLKLTFTGGGADSDAMFDTSLTVNTAPTTDYDLDFWLQVFSFGAPQALEFST